MTWTRNDVISFFSAKVCDSKLNEAAFPSLLIHPQHLSNIKQKQNSLVFQSLVLVLVPRSKLYFCGANGNSHYCHTTQELAKLLQI